MAALLLGITGGARLAFKYADVHGAATTEIAATLDPAEDSCTEHGDHDRGEICAPSSASPAMQTTIGYLEK